MTPSLLVLTPVPKQQQAASLWCCWFLWSPSTGLTFRSIWGSQNLVQGQVVALFFLLGLHSGEGVSEVQEQLQPNYSIRINKSRQTFSSYCGRNELTFFMEQLKSGLPAFITESQRPLSRRKFCRMGAMTWGQCLLLLIYPFQGCRLPLNICFTPLLLLTIKVYGLLSLCPTVNNPMTIKNRVR